MTNTMLRSKQFRRRVALAFGGLILVIILIGTSAFITLRTVARTTAEVADLSEELALVHDARLQTEQLVAVGRGYMLVGSSELQQRLATIDRRLALTLEELGRRATRAQRSDLTELSASADRYLTAIRRAGVQRAANRDEVAVVRLFEQETQPLRQRFEQLAETLVRTEKTAIRSAMSSAMNATQESQTSLGILLALALIFAVTLALTVARRVLDHYGEVVQAREVSRRASKAREELLATVSHDLRTPLTAVGLGTAVLQDAPLGPTQARACRSIASAVERMEHLIGDLLTREQLATGRLLLVYDRLDARSLVDTAIDLHRERASAKQVLLGADVTAEAFEGDRERLLQVLSNLLGNALKFARSGDSITVRVSPIPSAVLFEVVDTGPGISSELLPHVFDRFFQGEHRERGSLGLGLHICKRIVEAHGGTVGVESARDRGTTIRFTIPRFRPAADELSHDS